MERGGCERKRGEREDSERVEQEECVREGVGLERREWREEGEKRKG